MRRQVGIAGLQRQAREKEQFRHMGDRLAASQLQQLQDQMAQFKSSLELFATKHRAEIARNPAFRRQFAQMCAGMGVDPLTSSKGVWSDLLGVGGFYYELGVRVMELCIALRERWGPLVPLADAVKALNHERASAAAAVSEDDVTRAVKLLAPLGGGFALVDLPAANGTVAVIAAVPRELNLDADRVARMLGDAAGVRPVTAEDVARSTGWTADRAQRCLDLLVADGIVWVDTQDDATTYFWFSAELLA
ncbi:hypothetical protein AMAG_12919 [Allomyces macrogynus ATCC 38327]|uniref:Vacuolar-sorting protein SNF8 n=1 Tax=Allomyces macrogynus (strain ATCC 38327) TaxID=578462 RepID=A0A0L0T0R7_ALLM3|nr:hypothetical protein AMAG_12919 [Allomyces macrogynus ATCC 38327]|eukprot:KNE68245.1 hypothetical protein AMAG_12919 [Allomyces macrogynus ATCC 38327]